MRGANGTKPKKVWLLVGAGDVEREVEVEFAPGTPVSELTRALAEDLVPGIGTRSIIHSERLARDLNPDDPIEHSGLVFGDRVDLRAENAVLGTTDAASSAIDLVIVGGPLLGSRYRLDLGRHVVGRGSGSDVKVEDPSMSRRHLEVTVTANGITVADVGSTNGTFVDGERLTDTRALASDDVVEAGGSLISFEPAAAIAPATPSDGVRIPFNRPPRVRAAQDVLEVDAPAPPEEPTGPRIPLAVAVVPLVIGVVMVMLFPENKAMLLFFAMTPVIAVWSFLEERRSGNKSFRARRDEYLGEVAELEARLSSFVGEEVHERREAFPDAAELAARVRELSPRLWERRPHDSDFLAVRVGWGDEPSSARVEQPTGGSRSLRDETTERLLRFTMLRAVPIVVSLRDAHTTGLCGPTDDVNALARWALAQLAVLHSPEELEMAAIISSGNAAEWGWLKWCPHFGATSAAGRIAFESEALDLVERLAAGPDTPAQRAGVHMLVVIDGECDIPRSALGRLLGAGAGSGIAVLWLGRDPRALPGECRAVVEVDSGADTLRVVHPETGTRVEHPAPEGISRDLATAIARGLAGVSDVGITRTRRTIPTRVTLWAALDVAEPTTDLVRARWDHNDTSRRARLGMSSTGPLDVDLRGDGPHALIGGTTGAGKSELLQAMAASIAWTYSPERVNLLLIDYKGGTAFKDLDLLPHVVGSVTDLDVHLSRRALASLEAELKRREIVLREHDARDVLDLDRKGISGLPDLILVVDEFATLVTELPGFVDGIVDVAQRGRALGLHLILATQKPAGVVSEKIRANTNLRIALRMSDEADSTDVIGLADAARLPRTVPGRGYVRLGHGEVTEFQSAFASAPAVTARSDRINLRQLGATGPVTATATVTQDPDQRTQLEVLIEVIAEAGRGMGTPFSPVLQPLPEVLRLDRLGTPSGPGRFPIGMLDEPSAQRQQPFELDFDRNGSVLVYGAGGSGKTTLLRTIAASIATHARPDDVHIYALDLGTRGLGVLQALPHCGSVVYAEEDERIRRLFAMLRDEITRRRATSPNDAPRIVILLDGYAGFSAAFERVDFGEMVDALPRLVADGRQVGIHFVITADRRGAVPAALTGIIATRIVLRLADDDEYSAFGLSPGPDKEALAVRGRSFLGDGVLMQCAVAGEGASVAQQETGIEALARSAAASVPVPPVRTLPERLGVTSLPVPTSPQHIAIGLDERFEPAACVLERSHFLIVGPRRSGRTTGLATIAAQLGRLHEEPPLHLLSPRKSDLVSRFRWTSSAEGVEACEEWMRSSQDGLGAHPGSIVLIDDADELLEVASADTLQRTIKWARDHAVGFVIAVETHATHRAFGGWIAEMRKDKHGVLLEPDVEVDGDLFGIRLPRRKSKFPPGRGYLVTRGEPALIQVATAGL